MKPFSDPSSSSSASAPNPDHGIKHPPSIGDKVDITSEATYAVSPSPNSSEVNRLTDSMEDQSHLTGIAHPKRCKPAQEMEDFITQMKAEDGSNRKDGVKRKRRKGNDHEDKNPIVKKHKVGVKIADSLRPTIHNSVQNEKAGDQAEKDEKNAKQQVSAKPKRRGKVQFEVSISCPASSTKRSKPLPKASSRSHLTNLDGNVNNDHHKSPSAQDPAAVALNAQLCGMLIETMALSRASSLPLSSLYKMVMQTQPSLRLQRSEQEWLTVFARVLQEGEAEHGSGVFGKVESSGKVCFVICLRFRPHLLIIVVNRTILIDRWRHNGFMFRNKIKTKNEQR